MQLAFRYVSFILSDAAEATDQSYYSDHYALLRTFHLTLSLGLYSSSSGR